LDLISISPFQVASVLWRPADGSWVQTILCKATFDLRPGVATLAEKQEPPNQENSYWNGDPTCSLHAVRDLVPIKARADVLLVGRAFAPKGRAVRSLIARLAVGAVDKSIEVFGDRTWPTGGPLGEPAVFTTMPLVYELAAGGPDTTNPVGVITGPRAAAQGLTRMPNLQIAGLAPPDRSTLLSPIGFGPIATSWPERRRRLGALAGSWPKEGWNRRPMPEELDTAYFNAAPDDQQVEALSDDARIVLEHLHPEHSRLETALPGVRPRARLEIPGIPQQEVRMRFDTLAIDTDRAVATVVWRGQVSLRRSDEVGRVVVVMEEPRRVPVWAMGGPANDAPIPLVTPANKAHAVSLQPVAQEEKTEVMAVTVRAEVAQEPDSSERASPRARARGNEDSSPNEPPPTETSSTLAAAAPKPERAADSDKTALAPLTKDSPARESPARQSPATAARVLREALELAWYDRAALPKIRRSLRWEKIIAELPPAPSEGDADGQSPEQSEEARARRHVMAVLTRGDVQDLTGIARAMEMAIKDDGSFEPPYVLTAGTLEWLFDEVEKLKATLVIVAPFLRHDEKLKETAAHATEVMKTPGFELARNVAGGLAFQVKTAFERGSHGLTAEYLDRQVEAMMLDGGYYQRQKALGAQWIRALFTPAGAAETLPTYVSEKMVEALPLLRKPRMRVIAEARPQADETRADLCCLRIVAAATIVPVRVKSGAPG
jgi:hypothetical protein